ncbi:MAG: hypothetical protein ABI882_14950 [Acidobacteriota bacterium]
MTRLKATIFLLLSLAVPVAAQNEIRVSPRSVNVYSQGATTVFLTYGNLGDYRPAETQWCGDITPAGIGSACVPGTVYGTLPSRYDISRRSGVGGYTDVVSVPAAVARKAYQAAARGEGSEFYYVRRFVNPNGGPDQFVAVTMRLSGNGAGTPFSLTDVQLGFGASVGLTASGQDPLVAFVEPTGKLPSIRAEIKYTGTGRLRGRWEVVRPGDPLPSERDLLSEASLPVEERGSQARFTQLGRFNVFLAPGGRFTLTGPDASRIPNKVPGQYLILFRIEATNDPENESNLSAVGSGGSIIQSGGAAGFPMPVLRYVVGGGNNVQNVSSSAGGQFTSLLPRDGTTIAANQVVEFVWTEVPQVGLYRLEIEDDAGKLIHSAMVKPALRRYRAPSWLKAKAGGSSLRWRVVALDQAGVQMAETLRQRLRLN